MFRNEPNYPRFREWYKSIWHLKEVEKSTLEIEARIREQTMIELEKLYSQTDEILKNNPIEFV